MIELQLRTAIVQRLARVREALPVFVMASNATILGTFKTQALTPFVERCITSTTAHTRAGTVAAPRAGDQIKQFE